jgi:hypothetical protein
MQPAMIQAVLATGATIRSSAAHPVPWLSDALGIEIPEDKQGNVEFIVEQITKKIAEAV